MLRETRSLVHRRPEKEEGQEYWEREKVDTNLNLDRRKGLGWIHRRHGKEDRGSCWLQEEIGSVIDFYSWYKFESGLSSSWKRRGKDEARDQKWRVTLTFGPRTNPSQVRRRSDNRREAVIQREELWSITLLELREKSELDVSSTWKWRQNDVEWEKRSRKCNSLVVEELV